LLDFSFFELLQYILDVTAAQYESPVRVDDIVFAVTIMKIIKIPKQKGTYIFGPYHCLRCKTSDL